MWCTRWFLPLLLLPLPTAPPYFLLLFLFSLTLHAKPCFYCIVLLTTLFVSSCYWQPFPLDSPLSSPWDNNITTFAEALNATITSSYPKPLPDVMQTVDRCWCDFSAGGFFEPFNVSHWEHVSIERLKEELEHRQKAEDTVSQTMESLDVPTETVLMPRTAAPSPTTAQTQNARTTSIDYWALLFYPFYSRPNHRHERMPEPSTPRTSASSNPKLSSHSITSLPLIRKEYDLRPYGLGIVVDFGWAR
ncbi:hypothetical protein BDZ94DRAFT_1274742 [Collybia nuda]|uniref:Uncharacterized protein n=1 Tax=Collybia nuda TaxID=64659 RepID=A0A9P5XWF8_9AGAR|nr:hypothetical protein BDZ94DRAFT_1274742 [Collybia nuda]